MKAQARVAVIGGGVVGCSVLYHLTKFGWTDVVLIELATERIELWNLKRGVMPAPEGLNSAVLRRDGAGWAYGETSPPSV